MVFWNASSHFAMFGEDNVLQQYRYMAHLNITIVFNPYIFRMFSFFT